MNRSLKIFVACALGGGIGTFVALQLTPSFWWLGLIAGGFVGYASYDFKTVIVASREAWSKTVSIKLTREQVGWLLVSLCCLSNFLFFILTVWLVDKYQFPNPKASKQAFALVFYCLVTMMAACIRGAYLEQKKRGGFSAWEQQKFLMLHFNPIAALFGWPALVLRTIFKYFWKAIVLFPRAVCISGAFIKMVFILIHSEIRLLCMLDAAIGAGVGYYFGSALIRALAEELSGYSIFRSSQSGG